MPLQLSSRFVGQGSRKDEPPEFQGVGSESKSARHIKRSALLGRGALQKFACQAKVANQISAHLCQAACPTYMAPCCTGDFFPRLQVYGMFSAREGKHCDLK